MSGDGRAGATAPTTTDAVSEAAVAAYIRGYTFSEHLGTDEREARRDGLRAAFPVMLAQFVAEWSERGPYHVLTPDEDPNRLNDWTVAREGHYRKLQRPCFATSREAIARHVAAALNYEEARHG